MYVVRVCCISCIIYFYRNTELSVFVFWLSQQRLSKRKLKIDENISFAFKNVFVFSYFQPTNQAESA